MKYFQQVMLLITITVLIAMVVVFIACPDTLIYQIMHSNESSCELIACYKQLNNCSSLIVCSICCPPSSNESYLTELCHQLELIRNKYPNSALWSGGDTNIPDIDWSANSIQSHHYTLISS